MPVIDTIVPLTKPVIGPEEEHAVLDVLRSGWLVQGERVATFERRIAEYCGAKHAVATTNCTTALQLALTQLDLQPGDEVIVPSFTFVASANAVIHAGGVPRMVDVQADTWNIEPRDVERAINERTRAILPVDQFGLAADLDAVNRIAEEHGLRVVEDAAPSLGASIGGRRVGSISEMTCFSFHPRKTVTSAEGGMIVTDSDEIAQRCRLLRSHAASVSDLARHSSDDVIIEEYPEAGFNFRMSDLHAAVGLAQLDRLEWLIERRRELAARFDAAFAAIDEISVPAYRDGYLHTYQSYCVVLTDAARIDQATAMRELKARGITSRRGCMAIHLEPYFVKRYGLERLPVSEMLSKRSIAIPLYPTMTDEEQTRVIDAVRAVIV
ncbi:MAG TPA: DegT/DnrJ/EryC1/StrS family aminotransferase [Dehalococcoidia bacterium]